jgi:hypothetical protein
MMGKKKKKVIFGLLAESGKWCRPPGLLMAWKDPWMITGDGMYHILFEQKVGFLG